MAVSVGMAVPGQEGVSALAHAMGVSTLVHAMKVSTLVNAMGAGPVQPNVWPLGTAGMCGPFQC